MPASQLKRLKASLREQGITGGAPSKKQRKAQKASGDKNGNQRVQRNAALQQIRDSFNPFDVKTSNSVRPEKFASTSQASARSGRYKEVLHRPGVSKSAGEEMRRATLLPELQRRNKVGGVVDRRIGEGDTDMTPEERALMRFAKEKERKRKGATLFDLEASDDEAGYTFTHGGRNIDELAADDFDDEDISKQSADDSDEGELLRRKRRREDEAEAEQLNAAEADGADDQPERKRSKKEVMQEVIAKSKLHKYERQKAKEDDEELREELDSGMGDILALLKTGRRQSAPVTANKTQLDGSGPVMNPDRQKLVSGMDRTEVDKEYDVRLKQLAQDTRAKPSDRAKTAEEKAADEASRLQVLEEKRLRRMQGEDIDDDERGQGDDGTNNGVIVGPDEDVLDDAADFGFTSSNGIPVKEDRKVVLDDEDDFALDEDIIASGSDAGISELDSVDDSDDELSSLDEEDLGDDEETEFVQAILGADVVTTSTSANAIPLGQRTGTDPSGLKFTYPCPRTHEELSNIVGGLPAEQLITIIQRIRALYHPSLSATNKEAMSEFSCVLVDHLAFMAEKQQPLSIAEQVMRHLHSLSRTYPTQIGEAFRKHLSAFHERGQPTSGDLMILTAIGSIYPTSDHWHQVVTPAISLMAKWLGLNAPTIDSRPELKTLTTGAFLVDLCLKYQTLSKRYLPEVVRYILRVLVLAVKRPSLVDTTAHVENLLTIADVYADKSAFPQIFSAFLPLLKTLNLRKPHARLSVLLSQARMNARPLELHHHRPLPIRTSVPKFEEAFNPDKHYDPDKERSDSRKLQKEYKRERKGALRELRKDANFIAREQLREKRVRDEEYEKKYRRLVAEVQNEEGAAAREYDRERTRRQRKK